MFKKVKQKYIPTKLFESIDDMWLHNWEEMHIKNDSKWLIKSDRERARNPKISAERYEKVYFNLHDQYSKRTGAYEKMEEWHGLMLLRMDARAAYGNGDKFQINWIKKFDIMIEELMGDASEGISMRKTRALYSQAYGMDIDPRKKTVGEYLDIVELVQEQNRPKGRKEVD